MVRYPLDEVTDDMVLAQSLFTNGGDLLLAAGYRIGAPFRQRLKELGYDCVMVETEGTEGIIPETIISAQVQREMAVTLNKSTAELRNVFNFRKKTEKTIQAIIAENKEDIGRVIMNSGLGMVLEKIIEEVLLQPAVVLNLSAMEQKHQEIMAHVINVTLISLAIGRKYRFSYDEMKQLGAGAINYDVGLVAASKDVIEKPDPLTQDEILGLQQHTVHGHLILSQNPAFPATSSAVALQHHEFQDGSGYPRSIKGDNRPPHKDMLRTNMILRFAEIVTVADAFDMMVTGRPHYSRKVPLHAAIKRLIADSTNRYNADIVKTLLTMVPLYPVGARVKVLEAPLAELVGYFGVVAKSSVENAEELQVVLYETRHHKKIKSILIDMTEHKGFVLELLM